MADDFDLDWIDMALAGSLAEEMSEEEREARRLEEEMKTDEHECCCKDCSPCEPPEEPFIPDE